MSALRAASRTVLAWAILSSLVGSLSRQECSQDQGQRGRCATAAKLLSDGKAALVAKNNGQAKTLFEDAYRKNPSGEALFQLGKLAESEGRTVAAQDVMAVSPETTGDGWTGPKEAQRISSSDRASGG